MKLLAQQAVPTKQTVVFSRCLWLVALAMTFVAQLSDVQHGVGVLAGPRSPAKQNKEKEEEEERLINTLLACFHLTGFYAKRYMFQCSCQGT